MSETISSRRQFLGRSVLGLFVLSSGGALVSACGGEEAPNCTHPPGLTAAQGTQRTALHYLDHGTDPNRQCMKCNFFTAGQTAAACGGCALNLGDVSPLGTCDSFAARS